MLNWNEIISGLACAVAGFAYAVVFFVLLPFRQYDFAAPLWSIAMAIALIVAMNWLLSSSLLTAWSWVTALFACQIVLILFGSLFLGDGLYLPSFLFFGTMLVGVASIYTNFSQQKTLLIVALCTVFFIALIYLSLISSYALKGKNPFQGSSTQMQPLLNQRVEIITDNPQQLYLNGKTGELTHIDRYEVTVKLDDQTLIWPYVYVWWQDIKAAT
ncbi:hypothetical protein IQ270_08380 [Microcoleus sp. LEGE 07076]|uniref:hypothetical protein n=1 Tax=Microcoleus sp. LEGE 07076 TaxID=915322 RepID=UPI001880BA6A|nr:hypothetical protein [Microcoleus sp. LEGE 07076]MBE9184732.1 hypothetical protein [Microcoleus sp. LEGE 07076]